jgi:hypothetical protein
MYIGNLLVIVWVIAVGDAVGFFYNPGGNLGNIGILDIEFDTAV